MENFSLCNVSPFHNTIFAHIAHSQMFANRKNPASHFLLDRSKFYLLTILSVALFSGIAKAQNASFPISRIDINGVNLVTGRVSVRDASLSIGDEETGIEYYRTFSEKDGWRNNYQYTFSGLENGGYIIGVGDKISTFNSNGESPSKNGEFLLYDSNGGSPQFILTQPDGMKVFFDSSQLCCGYPTTPYPTNILPRKILFPNGKILTYNYKRIAFPGAPPSPFGYVNPEYIYIRLQSITSNTGYQIKFVYVSDEETNNFISMQKWQKISNVAVINNAVDYCDPIANRCSYTTNWPSINYSSTSNESGSVIETTTDQNGNSKKYYYSVAGGDYGFITKIEDTISSVNYSYGGSQGKISSINKNGSTWNYGWDVEEWSWDGEYYEPHYIGNVHTAPNGQQTKSMPGSIWNGVTSTPVLGSTTDALGKVTQYNYDLSARLSDIIYPEGNRIKYTYDDRGNLTETRLISKTPGSPPDIVTISSFSSSCSNPMICNKPNWVKDPMGNQTEYEYDSTHGGVIRVRSPAPSLGGARPETRLSYTPLQAWYKNASGAIVASGQSVYRLSATSACQTMVSCIGTGDEVRTTIGYETGSAGVKSNLLTNSKVLGSGLGDLSATNVSTYDNVGNVIAVDGPLPGSADTMRYRFDASRRIVGVTSPDPDGAGNLPARAIRINYNSDGQIKTREIGTVLDQSDSAWSAYSSAQTLTSIYDPVGHKIKEVLSSGMTIFGMKQFSYDETGRVDCSAIRMDPGQWNGQTNVCTPQTNGPNGPDRIVKYVYDATDRPIGVIDGYGTSAQRNERTTTYTSNGLVNTIRDAKNNLTTYEFDGFDRLFKTRYPVGTVGAISSSLSDYEQVSYNANGNVVDRRGRDGSTIYFSYDNLNRLIFKDRPNNTWWETDNTYTYDLFSRINMAKDSNGHTINIFYDALGRKVREASNWYGNMNSTYDLSDRRVALAWPDGFYVTYDHLVTGEITTVRENGSMSGIGLLANYFYDNLGRRISMTRGNGATTYFAYDNVSRLAGLTQDLAGTAQDLNLNFSYNAASQITSKSSSNDSYIFAQNYNVNRGYSTNGLNQYGSAGAVALGYDARGNLTSSGEGSYGYTVENQLATAPGSNYAYDPLGRLFHESTPNSAFLYDGSNIMLERDAGNGTIRRRYVYGPETDEPIVWYEGAGISDRRWLHADERGSIIAVTNSSGTAIAVNSYDEYGIPASGNLGRFQYTGQMWLPNIGMYSYKARIYSPTLGRFMQTDPIGYGDGLNWHAYVRNDPINGTDTSGLNGSLDDTDYASREAVDIIVNANRWVSDTVSSVTSSGLDSRSSGRDDPVPQNGQAGDIVVTAKRPQLQGACSECMLMALFPATRIIKLGMRIYDLIVGPSKPNWTLGSGKSAQKWQNQMSKRGWTGNQIDDAIQNGESFSAPNNLNPGNGATRYVNPQTGQSVVIDNATGQVIHVGGPSFVY